MKPLIIETNISEGTDTQREMTDKELKQYLIDQKQAGEIILGTREKAKNRESALQKLAALGLTADEIAALAG